MIHRAGKLGLGTAYAAGFQKAIAAGNDLILTMDADFSHDPQYLPAMLAASRRYDLVIGSRYVPGGGVRDWPWHRQVLSWGANTIATCCWACMRGTAQQDFAATGARCWKRSIRRPSGPTAIPI